MNGRERTVKEKGQSGKIQTSKKQTRGSEREWEREGGGTSLSSFQIPEKRMGRASDAIIPIVSHVTTLTIHVVMYGHFETGRIVPWRRCIMSVSTPNPIQVCGYCGGTFGTRRGASNIHKNGANPRTNIRPPLVVCPARFQNSTVGCLVRKFDGVGCRTASHPHVLAHETA